MPSTNKPPGGKLSVGQLVLVGGVLTHVRSIVGGRARLGIGWSVDLPTALKPFSLEEKERQVASFVLPRSQE